jgi:cellulose synthase operon protein C
MVTTVGQLAEIKLEPSEDAEARLTAIVRDVADDPRASIVAADFAMRLGHDKIGERAYQNALRKIDVDSHIARRLMVAMYAAKRADWKSVADLLDGHVDEEYDSEELRMLATAMVNDSPIRRPPSTSSRGYLPRSMVCSSTCMWWGYFTSTVAP